MTEDYAQDWADGSLPEKEKDEIREALLDALATEFFQPLNRIALNREYLQLHLARERANYSAEKVDEALEGIDTAVSSMSRLINNCLDLMTCLQGRMRPQMVAVDMGALLADVAANSVQAGRLLGLTIAFEPPKEDICIETDRQMAERILLNLLSNAMCASTSGGTITLSLQKTADGCRFSVQDEGCGVSAAFAAQAFHPFRREDCRNKERTLGRAGLGLILCEEFCRLLGWRPEMRAAKRGTTATVHIPAAQLAGGRVLVFHSAPAERQRLSEELSAAVWQELRAVPGLENWEKQNDAEQSF